MRVAILFAAAATASAATLTVSPGGPLRTLDQARDQIRTLRTQSKLADGEAVTVIVRRGVYFVEHSIQFDDRDSGVTYRAESGARLVGGRRLTRWRPVRDLQVRERLAPDARGHVLEIDLGRQGITPGNFSARGFGREAQSAHAELFFKGRRMTVARWPNDGFTRIASAADTEPHDDEHGGRIGRLDRGFLYEGDRPGHWQSDPNIWVHGYWSWDWADTYERVASIDAKTRLVLTAPPHGIYGFRRNQRYTFLNVLEELDSAGEYYVDFPNRKLYFWPPSDPRQAEIFVSVTDEALLDFRDARDVTVDGFTLEYTRGRAVTVHDGASVTLRNLAVRNTGGAGIVIEGGFRHTVERSEIAYTGDSAIEITGGDRRTLTPAGHAVRDCDLHHMGEWVRTYNPAVKVNGVGNLVEHNAIHHGPHAGILLTGNDHVIDGNDMHHLALETGDVGAIYLGRDYTERGVMIRHNYIHELGGVGLGSMAVYLDDCASGVTVLGNVFYKLKYGAFVGGGRDNRVENNLFVACSPAIHVDARGLDPRPVWQDMVYRTMKPKLAQMRVTEPPYRERYPEILSVLPYLEKAGGVPPEGNLIRRNLISGPAFDIRKPAEPFVGNLNGNLTLEDGFSFDPDARIYRLPDREDIRALGFAPIPLDRAGPRK